MLRYGLSLLAFTAVLAASVDARAGSVSELTLDGIPDVLVDDDYETQISSGVAGFVDDIFLGIFEIDAINGNDMSDDGFTFTGFIIAKVATAVSPLAGLTVMTFAPLSDAEYTALQGTYTNLPLTRESSLSALFVYDDHVKNLGGPGEYVNPAFGADLNDALSTVDGPLEFEFGFSGTTYTNATLSGGVLSFQLALNNTYSASAIDFLPLATIPGVFPVATDIQIAGGSAPGLPSGHFDFTTTSTMLVNPVPEPGSMTLLSLGALGLLGVRLRRKQAA